MLSATKVMNELKNAGFINDWRWTKTNAAWSDDDKPLWEKNIKADCNGLPSIIINNEVYGDKTMLYFICRNDKLAKRVANFLKDLGGEPSFRWCKNQPDRFDMQVSYFKGNRWWE